MIELRTVPEFALSARTASTVFRFVLPRMLAGRVEMMLFEATWASCCSCVASSSRTTPAAAVELFSSSTVASTRFRMASRGVS